MTTLPLLELWRDDRSSTTKRGRSLTTLDIGELLAAGVVQFVVADVGTAPRWIPPSECFNFWKSEAKPHIANEAAVLDQFPGGYCYFASLWQHQEVEAPVVVLEKHH